MTPSWPSSSKAPLTSTVHMPTWLACSCATPRVDSAPFYGTTGVNGDLHLASQRSPRDDGIGDQGAAQGRPRGQPREQTRGQTRGQPREQTRDFDGCNV
jgi:hypothetical protein